MKAKVGNSFGFSLLEVVMAIIVLVVGLLSLLTLFSQSIVSMYLVQEDLIAGQKAREAVESIYAARDTQQITFDMIQNIPSGIFLDGFQALRLPNPVGLLGTADGGTVEEIHLPGPDGQLGTADDQVRPLTNFERRIEVVPVLDISGTPYPDLRQVAVTVRYTTTEGWQRSYLLTSYISRYR